VQNPLTLRALFSYAVGAFIVVWRKTGGMLLMKIKMKRSLSLLLTVCFLLGALPFTIAIDDVEPGDIVCTDEAADVEVVTPVVKEDDGEDEIAEEKKEEAVQNGYGYAQSEELPDELDDAESEKLSDELDDAELEKLSDELNDTDSENDTGTEMSTMDDDADAADLPMITMLTDETVEQVSMVAMSSASGINLWDNPDSRPDEGDGWSWDKSTSTLTLNDVDLDVTGEAAIIMPNGIPSTIVLIGNNTIKGNNVGINASGDLTIRGNGRLNINSEYAGISVNSGNLTISDSTIMLNVAEDDGIFVSNHIKITNAAKTVNTPKWIGIFTQNGNVTITGSTLDITAGLQGIDAFGGDVTIIGGTFNFDAGTVGIAAWNGNVTIDGGTFDIVAKTENGIWSKGNITISNAAITLNTKLNSIQSDTAIKINDSEIKITSDQSGILATGNVTINGGTLEITAEEYGLWSDGNITISNAKITLNTGLAGINSFNGNVEITATELKIDSNVGGIGAHGNVTITGGTFKIDLLVDGHGVAGAEVTISSSGTINVPHANSEKFVVRATGTLTHPEMLVFGWDGTGYTVASSIVKLTQGYTFVNVINTDEVLARIQFVPIPRTVTFDGNGGIPSEATRIVGHGRAIGTLPTASQSGYSFNGWFTQASGGTQISESHIITGDITFFAQWTFAGDDGGETKPETPDYTFNDGNNTFVQGSGQPLVLTIQKDFALFDDVLVNNTTLIRDTHYTAQSGSTKITLLPAFLDTLAPGQHTVEIRFTDGDSVITTFTIEATQENTTSEPETETGDSDNSTGLPQTGVDSYIPILSTLLIFSMLGAALIWYKLRKTGQGDGSSVLRK
jgi:uncharacterized repeat protein (TIGR02543 family)